MVTTSTSKQPLLMNFICFDTEDDSAELLAAGKSGFDKQVTQIAAITGEGKRFYSPGQVEPFLQWLKHQPERMIYAHNLQYDLGNLFSTKLDCLDTTLVGGRVIKAVWGNKIFVDSFNIWPMSAKKLGKAFDLEKLETTSMATDREYVFRDVEIIRRAMLFAWQFCQPLGIEVLPPTLGGLCVKIWRAWRGENCHDSNQLSRAAYYGGRVELFKKHNDSDDVCYTDINSLYPAMMLKEFPGPLEDCGTELPPHGVARVRIKIPKCGIGPLPWRDDDGRIFYPWGTLEGAWVMPELKAAVARGAKIEKVFEAYGTDETSKPYAEFVTRLYAARLTAKSEAEKLFFKLLMNNLYGRLGSGGKIGRSVWQNDKNKFAGVPFGEKVLVEYQMPLSEETNWIHAAYVTAYGRLQLLEYLETIGTEHLIYCDTDSTIFDCPGRSIPFAVGTDLGQMKLESWETCCETYAPKQYRSGKKFKAKGVPQRLAQTFIETGKAQFDLPFKLREAIRFYDRNNKRQLSVWRKVTKENRQSYDRKHFKNNRFFPCKKFCSVQ